MNGFRFYADLPGTEYDPEDSGFPRGRLPKRMTVERLAVLAEAGIKVNCIALLIGDAHRCHNYAQEALVATFGHPDSDTSLGSVDREYLRKCKRVPEKIARRLHPCLFTRLDAAEG